MEEKRIIKGRIISGIGGLYQVATEDDVIACRAKGAFRHNMETPTVGDTVTVSTDGGAMINEIVDRRNILIRPPIANLNFLFCVIPVANPSPDIFTLDKLIAIAENSEIEPVIVITKADLDSEYADKLYSLYQRAGFSTFKVSVYEEESIKPLETFIRESASFGISAFAGASGAGKSTLMNALFPKLKIVTGEVSRKIGRGRHTTRAVNLYPLSSLLNLPVDGFLADTPGFTMLDFERFDFFELEDLPYTFREFSEHIGLCKYTRCTHLCEEGCSIVEAVSRGEIAKSRHEGYASLYAILKAKPPKSHKK